MRRPLELWALLLNHGYRLAATASSDACFDRPGGGVPGSARTYTYLPNGFSWAGRCQGDGRGADLCHHRPRCCWQRWRASHPAHRGQQMDSRAR